MLRVSSGIEMLKSFDCLDINEFGAVHLNIYSDAHEYSLECP